MFDHIQHMGFVFPCFTFHKCFHCYILVHNSLSGTIEEKKYVKRVFHVNDAIVLKNPCKCYITSKENFINSGKDSKLKYCNEIL